MNGPENNKSPDAIENIAIFGGTFVVTQVAEYFGDLSHNPHVMDVPHGAVIIIGLVISGLSTAVYNVRNRR